MTGSKESFGHDRCSVIDSPDNLYGWTTQKTDFMLRAGQNRRFTEMHTWKSLRKPSEKTLQVVKR